MLETALIVSAAAVFAYALIAGRLADTIVTAPMVFILLGWTLEFAGLLNLENGHAVLHLLAEITLIMVLFSDAAGINFKSLRREILWPRRMLVFGLPLAILFGFGIGAVLLPGWNLWEIALLAAILAPTDAALGQSVVSNPDVPKRVRQTINVESGVNDGLALPAVLFFASMAAGSDLRDGAQGTDLGWLQFAARQIGIGLLVGAGLGWLGGQALGIAVSRRWSTETFSGVAELALAGLCYLAAIALGGNGFLAAFAGGVAFGTALDVRGRFISEFLEAEGQILILTTFLLVGAVLLPGALAGLQWEEIALIFASLLVVRPLAIWISMAGTGADAITKLFLGWFGPRGLATALFALLVLDSFENIARGNDILAIATSAVAFSALLHGMSAAPAARFLARRARRKHAAGPGSGTVDADHAADPPDEPDPR